MAKEQDDSQGGTPSPFHFGESERDMVRKILHHMELLRVPVMQLHLQGKCSRDCHLLERNHTLDAIENFIKEVCKLE